MLAILDVGGHGGHVVNLNLLLEVGVVSDVVLLHEGSLLLWARPVPSRHVALALSTCQGQLVCVLVHLRVGVSDLLLVEVGDSLLVAGLAGPLSEDDALSEHLVVPGLRRVQVVVAGARVRSQRVAVGAGLLGAVLVAVVAVSVAAVSVVAVRFAAVATISRVAIATVALVVGGGGVVLARVAAVLAAAVVRVGVLLAVGGAVPSVAAVLVAAV